MKQVILMSKWAAELLLLAARIAYEYIIRKIRSQYGKETIGKNPESADDATEPAEP